MPLLALPPFMGGERQGEGLAVGQQGDVGEENLTMTNVGMGLTNVGVELTNVGMGLTNVGLGLTNVGVGRIVGTARL